MSEEKMVGAWELVANLKDVPIDDVPMQAFNEATCGLTGARYNALAHIATQVVSGAKYMFLAEQLLTDADHTHNLVIINIYHDLENKNAVSSISVVG